MFILSKPSSVNASHSKPSGPAIESLIPSLPDWRQGEGAGWWATQGAGEWWGGLVHLPLLVWAQRGTVGGFFPPVEHLPSNAADFWVPYPAAMQSAWGVAAWGAWVWHWLLAEQCQSTRVLLNFWRGGGVLAAGLPPGGLASAGAVAVLQGAVMNKQLDKLPFFFFLSLNADTVTHALKLA